MFLLPSCLQDLPHVYLLLPQSCLALQVELGSTAALLRILLQMSSCAYFVRSLGYFSSLQLPNLAPWQPHQVAARQQRSQCFVPTGFLMRHICWHHIDHTKVTEWQASVFFDVELVVRAFSQISYKNFQPEGRWNTQHEEAAFCSLRFGSLALGKKISVTESLPVLYHS